MALLSVLVPTWNGEATLGRTLECLLSQEGPELEILVCDDASTDGTVQAALAFGDRRIEVHRNRERAGIVGNWNRGLGLVRGKYVAVVGQDDEVDPGWARSLVDLLERHPEADLAFSRRRFVYDDEESRKVVGHFFSGIYPEMLRAFYGRIGEVIPPEVMFREALVHHFRINLIGEPSFVIFRRENPAVEEGFDPLMTQMMDWEFFTRFFKDKPILHCPKVLGTYHIRGKGASVDNAKNLVRHHREFDHLLELVLERFRAFLDEESRALLREKQREARQEAARLSSGGD